jgi:hypothetical protein
MPPGGPDPDFLISGERTFIAVNMEKIAMATRERTYRCVGGPCDGMFQALGEERLIRLPSQQDVAAMPPPNRADEPPYWDRGTRTAALAHLRPKT